MTNVRRVVLAMSGGVDSSASAVLLKEQGWDVIGLFMRSGTTETESCQLPSGKPESGNQLPILNKPLRKQGCCSSSDAADARRVADLLDIPFHALNFEDSFGRIQDYFVQEYYAGRTPNPCVMCNIWLKFGKLWEFAQQVGATHIATGHYARITTNHLGDTCLSRGYDLSKDQSYVLFGIRREILPNVMFPVGNSTKTQIRELAAQAGLKNAFKPDSQEICFIPDNDYVSYLARYQEKQVAAGTSAVATLPETAGDFVDPKGNVLGRHAGYERFTIGQRKGLGIAFGEPRFVIRIDPETRQVILGTKEDLASPVLTAHRLNWLTTASDSFRCLAQIRSQHQAAAATVEKLDHDHIRVTFDEPQLGVAPGQAVVLYHDQQVLGGGWITQ